MSERKKPKPPKKPNKSGHSTLADHRRQGKVFTSPMNTLPTTSVPWLRDVFPSLLWGCAVLTQHGLTRGSELIGSVLDRLGPFIETEAPNDAERPAVGPVLDGTLQAFDVIPEDRRAEALAALKENGLYEEAFPWLLVRALSQYENVPGRWVLGGWEGNEQIAAADAPEAFLAQVVVDSWHGQSEVATRAKMLHARAYMYAGRVHFSDQIDFVRLLPRYPNRLTEEERGIADSSMRAMFGAMWGLREDSQADPTEWATDFWRQNWTLYACTSQQPATGDADPQVSASEGNHQSLWREAQERWEAQLGAIEEQFHSAHSKTDPDLYAPDRNEVLTGITSRHLRSAQAMIRYPGLWSAEHGAGIIRSLVEGRIVQKWLIHKNDPDLFTKFKEYGRGHLKLHVLHLREYHESLDEPIEGLEDTIASMEDLLNRDLMEEFQDISVEGSFTKTNTRDMAYAVGLTRDYRLVFAPMSANVHSEWIALEQYALVPCGNPLHRGHRIPNRDVRILIGAEVVDLALNILEGMVEDYTLGI